MPTPMKVDVFVTHFVTSTTRGLNDMLVEACHELVETAVHAHRLTVVAWTDSAACWKDMEARLPAGTRLVRSDRSGRSDLPPSMRNKVVEEARRSGCDLMVLLHNDIRPARGWLLRLVSDIRWAESTWGQGSSLVTPRYVPYHLVKPHDAALRSEAFWSALGQSASVLTVDGMRRFCAQHGLPLRCERVHCPAYKQPTDDGHQLMMFACRPDYFDAFGLCDEGYTGREYDDCDWGIRALRAGKRNLLSQTAIIGHLEGMTFASRGIVSAGTRETNRDVFLRKWGSAMLDELEAGSLWPRLHHEQDAARAAPLDPTSR